MQALVKDKLNEIQKLMRFYKVEKAYVFGSAATGNMKPGSDVDFVIRFPANMDFETYGNNYFDLLYALQDLLKREVELVAEETISNPFFKESIEGSKVLVL